MTLYDELARRLEYKGTPSHVFINYMINKLAVNLYNLDKQDLLAVIDAQLLRKAFPMSQACAKRYINDKDPVGFLDRHNIKTQCRRLSAKHSTFYLSYRNLKKLATMSTPLTLVLEHSQMIINAFALYLTKS